MVEIRPFKAIRPNEKVAEKVAELPYDAVDSKEAKEYAKGNPYSYFHIDKAEIDLPSDLLPNNPKIYQKAAENLSKFLENGWLMKEDTPCYYLYQLTMGEKKQTGLVVCTSIDDYIDEKIKKHEYTRLEKERDRISHIEACDANTSPTLLTYRFDEKLQEIIVNWQQRHDPIYDFTRYYEVRHEVWVINEPKIINEITKIFANISALYIADGHHRTESAVKVGLKKREEQKESLESNYFASILFPSDELTILEYNRLLDVPIPNDFLERLAKNFVVVESKEKKPQKSGELVMYLKGKWYQLMIKPEKRSADLVKKLDVSFLQENVFAPIFGINDVRTDERIDFVGGIRGPEELANRVDKGEATLAFIMYPTQMKDLLKVADAKKIMPPKSTWFEPKLLSGLFLHDLETKKRHNFLEK